MQYLHRLLQEHEAARTTAQLLGIEQQALAAFEKQYLNSQSLLTRAPSLKEVVREIYSKSPGVPVSFL